MAHFKDLRLDEFEHLTKIDLPGIKKMIADYNDCYIISENNKIDTQRMDVDYALKQVLGYGMGTILVFGDADIIYYEGEEANDRWISKRK